MILRKLLWVLGIGICISTGLSVKVTSQTNVYQTATALFMTEVAKCSPQLPPCVVGRQVGRRLADGIASFMVSQNMPAEKAVPLVKDWLKLYHNKEVDARCLLDTFDLRFERLFKKYKAEANGQCKALEHADFHSHERHSSPRKAKTKMHQKTIRKAKKRLMKMESKIKDLIEKAETAETTEERFKIEQSLEIVRLKRRSIQRRQCKAEVDSVKSELKQKRRLLHTNFAAMYESLRQGADTETCKAREKVERDYRDTRHLEQIIAQKRKSDICRRSSKLASYRESIKRYQEKLANPECDFDKAKLRKIVHRLQSLVTLERHRVDLSRYHRLLRKQKRLQRLISVAKKYQEHGCHQLNLKLLHAVRVAENFKHKLEEEKLACHRLPASAHLNLLQAVDVDRVFASQKKREKHACRKAEAVTDLSLLRVVDVGEEVKRSAAKEKRDCSNAKVDQNLKLLEAVDIDEASEHAYSEARRHGATHEAAHQGIHRSSIQVSSKSAKISHSSASHQERRSESRSSTRLHEKAQASKLHSTSSKSSHSTTSSSKKLSKIKEAQISTKDLSSLKKITKDSVLRASRSASHRESSTKSASSAKSSHSKAVAEHSKASARTVSSKHKVASKHEVAKSESSSHASKKKNDLKNVDLKKSARKESTHQSDRKNALSTRSAKAKTEVESKKKTSAKTEIKHPESRKSHAVGDKSTQASGKDGFRGKKRPGEATEAKARHHRIVLQDLYIQKNYTVKKTASGIIYGIPPPVAIGQINDVNRRLVIIVTREADAVASSATRKAVVVRASTVSAHVFAVQKLTAAGRVLKSNVTATLQLARKTKEQERAEADAKQRAKYEAQVKSLIALAKQQAVAYNSIVEKVNVHQREIQQASVEIVEIIQKPLDISPAVVGSLPEQSLVDIQELEKPVDPDGSVEEVATVEVDQLEKENNLIISEIRQVISQETDKDNQQLALELLRQIEVASSLQPATVKKLLETERLLVHYETEIIVYQEKESEAFDPRVKADIRAKISELQKDMAQEQKEILDQWTNLDGRQDKMRLAVQNISKRLHKHLRLVPNLKPKQHEKPTIHPISQYESGAVVEVEAVGVTAVGDANAAKTAELRHLASVSTSEETKQYVGRQVDMIADLQSEVRLAVVEVIEIHNIIVRKEKAERELDNQIALEVAVKKRVLLEQRMAALQAAIEHYHRKHNRKIRAINEKQMRVNRRIERIAHKTGKVIGLVPLVKQEKIFRKGIASRPFKRVIVKEKAPLVLPPPTGDAKAGVEELKKKLKVLEANRNRHGRVHETDEIIRQLRVQLKLLKGKYEQLKLQHQHFIAETVTQHGNASCIANASLAGRTNSSDHAVHRPSSAFSSNGSHSEESSFSHESHSTSESHSYHEHREHTESYEHHEKHVLIVSEPEVITEIHIRPKPKFVNLRKKLRIPGTEKPAVEKEKPKIEKPRKKRFTHLRSKLGHDEKERRNRWPKVVAYKRDPHKHVKVVSYFAPHKKVYLDGNGHPSSAAEHLAKQSMANFEATKKFYQSQVLAKALLI